MNNFLRSVIRFISGGAKAFTRFPAAMASAGALAVLTTIRIALDQPANTHWFDSLQWAMAFGAIFSLALIAAVQSRIGQPRFFWLANGAGLLGAGAAFAALYLPGGSLQGILLNRLIAAMAISLIAFILIAGYPREQSSFNDSFFMTHKSLLIAALYGLVILLGLYFVAFTVKSLLYENLSSKTYAYIGIWSGLLTYAFFLGYFPDFRKGQTDGGRTVAQKQPHFIEILFAYVMIPIVLVLTLVLLLWTIQIVITGNWPEFTQLSAIAAGYALGGVWLVIMVSTRDVPLIRFYRRLYPVAALVILGFEAWALVRQLRISGLKNTEYGFGLLWLFAVAAAIILLIRQTRSNHWLAWLAMGLILVSVAPAVNYQDLPVWAQAARLKNLLTANAMLTDSSIVPSASISMQDQEKITDAAYYISDRQSFARPGWLPANLQDSSIFHQTFGFDPRWPGAANDNTYLYSLLYLPGGGIDLTGYQWAVNLRDTKGDGQTEFAGQQGTYLVSWRVTSTANVPRLTLSRNGQTLIDQDLGDYLRRLADQYPLRSEYKETVPVTADDLLWTLETDDIRLRLVFASIDMNRQGSGDIYYNVTLQGIYLGEK